MADQSVKFDISINIDSQITNVINRDSGNAYKGKLIAANGEYKFNLGVNATEDAFDGDFWGRVTPSGGKATVDIPLFSCTADGELVLVKG